MNIGRLRHRVTIQQATTSLDEHRKVERTWSTLATVWADVKGSYGVEGVDADIVESRTYHSVTLRYRSDFNAADNRFLWGSRILEPISVIDPEGRDRMMVCVCIEVVS